MKNLTQEWKDIDWESYQKYVFTLQCKIIDASKKGYKITMRRLEKRLLNSRRAKRWSVRLVAQKSKGRKTAGPDGVSADNLTLAKLNNMADQLTPQHQPSPVKRIEIDKPNSTAKRGLGIPNMSDRAHQAHLLMALAPEWEPRFSDRQYGFRKGRSAQDAIAYIRQCVRASSKFVLDADIEKCFDRIDHEALLSYIDTFPEMEKALRRILKTGALHKGQFIPGKKGTPQGGVISPLLANIVMSGLKEYIEREFKEQRRSIGVKSPKAPYLCLYADDLVILHDELVVIEWVQTIVSDYLARFGLNLNLKKTRICHTLNKHSDEDPGFDFLGFHIRQHRVGKYSPQPFGKSITTLITPSKDAQKRFRTKASEIIKGCKLSGKHRESRRNKTRKGKTDPATLMIISLNRLITGWANYYRYQNASKAFSQLDSYVHERLWAWAIRQFPKKNRQWIIDRIFSGVETDRKGQPLKRLNGELRERKWAFMSPFVCKDNPHKTVKKLTDHTSRKHQLVIGGKSYFDRDWAYWATRQGDYPLINSSIATCMKRQGGKCYSCERKINSDQRVVIHTRRDASRKNVLSHHSCNTTLNQNSKGSICINNAP